MPRPDEPAPSVFWLRRHDQQTIAVLAMVVIVALALAWLVLGGVTGGLVEIDRQPRREAPFRVDLNTAPWPDATTLQLPKTIVFGRGDLPTVQFDHRRTPAIDGAAEFLIGFLAKGPRSHAEALTTAAVEAIGRSAVYRAARRLGVIQDGGQWRLPRRRKGA